MTNASRIGAVGGTSVSVHGGKGFFMSIELVRPGDKGFNNVVLLDQG